MLHKVQIIGIGPGREDYLLPIAKRKIEQADCLIGAKRHLSLFSGLHKERVVIKGHFNQALDYIKKYKNKKRIAVLVSGDPGLYSFLGNISQVLPPEEYEVTPGISTVQLAFARIGLTWSDAKIISLHGRKIDNLNAEVRTSNKIFLFTDADFPPPKIAAYLLKKGLENKRAVVLENISYPNERITDTDLERLKKMRGFGFCSIIIEGKKKNLSGPKLYGIGIGPGDPGLVTLKAKEILERVDTVFVPKGSEDGSSWARAIVEEVCPAPKNFVELTFPMTKNPSVLNRYWQKASRRIAQEINRGREVAFVTIGDPFIYSTYVYLLKTMRKNFPDIGIETIPGISSFNACASAANFALVEGDERMAVVAVRKDLKGLRETLGEFETVVLMKVGSKLERVIGLLKELGRIKDALLISRIGHKDEKIVWDLKTLRDKKAGYLSVIIVKKITTNK